MLKDLKRVRNVIFNAVQTLNDEYKKADFNVSAGVFKRVIMLTVHYTVGKNRFEKIFHVDTKYITCYSDLYNKIYKILRNDFVQRFRAVQP